MLPQYERLTYSLDSIRAEHNVTIAASHESFTLRQAASFTAAGMLVSAGEELSEHTLEPVGVVSNSDGQVFIIVRNEGKPLGESPGIKTMQLISASASEKKELAQLMVSRLSGLHASGFGCGGLSPQKLAFTSAEARLVDPTSLFALEESDSTFYEAAVTLRSAVASGLVDKSELTSLSALYLSSPVSRQGVRLHLDKTKKPPKSDSDVVNGLASKAEDLLQLF